MSDCCNGDGLISIEEAIQRIQTLSRPIEATETVQLADALGRVLVTDVFAAVNVPSSDNSAMDGYGYRHSDLAEFDVLNIVGESFAGQPFEGIIEAGQCVRIMTGAMIPASVDTVVMQENTQRHGDELRVEKPPKCGSNIRRAGEDITKGRRVYMAGHEISAIDIGILASIGVAQVDLRKRPRIGVFSTGDELRQPGETLEEGQIYDSNRHTVLAMLSKLPVDCVDYGCLPDCYDTIARVVAQADRECDVLITSGGVSVGDADYTRDVLNQYGELDFWKLAIKPGKPFAFGRLKNSLFFGLPGNPVSATVTFHQLVVTAIRRMAGQTRTQTKPKHAFSTTELRKKPGRTDFQRGVVSYKEGKRWVEPTGKQGSGMLSSMALANCYVVLERERGDVSAGEQVMVLEFDQLLS